MTDAALAALRALRQLDAATVQPPAADAEPHDVMTRGEQLLAAREQPLRDLAGALDSEPGALRGVAEASSLHDAIQQRAASWHAALARAKYLVGERMVSASRLRGARR